MSGTVVLIVLFAAFLHASWNAVVKSEGDKFLNTVVVVTSAGVIAMICLPFLPVPARESCGPLVGEFLSAQKWSGIALICCGVLVLALEARRRAGANRATTVFALINALVIATYTLIDGIGVRHSGAP
eukprot:gene27231-32808_t